MGEVVVEVEVLGVGMWNCGVVECGFGASLSLG